MGASSVFDINTLASGSLGLGLSVSRGNTVLGEYLWDVAQSGDQDVAFSFAAVVGEELTLSAFMLSGATLENTNFAQSALPYLLAETGASLNGDFSVSAVPEPESLALFLSGLGLLAWVKRRRNTK